MERAYAGLDSLGAFNVRRGTLSASAGGRTATSHSRSSETRFSPGLRAGVTCVLVVQHLVRNIHVVLVDGRSFNAKNQARRFIHPNVRLHPETPLFTPFLCLIHIRVVLPFLIRGRAGYRK